MVGQNGSLVFVFSGGTYSILPNVNGTTTSEFAFGVNDKETIVGQYADSNTGTTSGVVYRSCAFTTFNPVVNVPVTNAQGINNNGLVTRFYSTDGTHSHGFLFNTGTASYTLIADPNVPNFVFSQLLGINDKGIVVGYYGTTNTSQRGFLYDATGQYTFLDDPNQAVINGVSVTQILRSPASATRERSPDFT